MIAASMTKGLERTQEFFNRSTSVLEEADSGFAPEAHTYTVAQQVAHTAQTIEWFLDGTFGDKGWDLDFATHDAEARAVTSLTEARARLAAAFERAVREIGGKSDEELNAPFPADDPIMPGAPRLAIVSAIVDHTAHHRGALTVYARLLGKQPAMPYM